MRKTVTTFLVFALALVGLIGLLPSAFADPIPGSYSSALRPGMSPGVQVGRASTARQFVNSGNPKIFNAQSWTGSVLGAQWEIKCGVETTLTPPDSSNFNKVTGTGWITYHQTFTGGTFALYADPAVGWGSGTGTLATTSVISQVQFIGFMPFASSFTGVTSGTFDIGCTMDFAMANGFGVGETPYLAKPATYPVFLAADCSPADVNHQFGNWGDVNDIIVKINNDCTVDAKTSTWGQIKTLYR